MCVSEDSAGSLSRGPDISGWIRVSAVSLWMGSSSVALVWTVGINRVVSGQ